MANIEILGMDAFNAKVNAIIAAKATALKAGGQAVYQDLMENYDSQGAKYGGAWSPRIPPTGNWNILHKTGFLESSISMESDDNSVSIGTSVPYAPALNFGYEPHNLVARPFIFFNNEIANDFMDAYMNQMQKVTQ